MRAPIRAGALAPSPPAGPSARPPAAPLTPGPRLRPGRRPAGGRGAARPGRWQRHSPASSHSPPSTCASGCECLCHGRVERCARRSEPAGGVSLPPRFAGPPANSALLPNAAVRGPGGAPALPGGASGPAPLPPGGGKSRPQAAQVSEAEGVKTASDLPPYLASRWPRKPAYSRAGDDKPSHNSGAKPSNSRNNSRTPS
jgi:hypothetical protein